MNCLHDKHRSGDLITLAILSNAQGVKVAEMQGVLAVFLESLRSLFAFYFRTKKSREEQSLHPSWALFLNSSCYAED